MVNKEEMMEEVEVKIVQLDEDLELPRYETEGSAGMDLMSSSKQTIEVPPMGRCLLPTGIKIQLPIGYEAQIRARSGLALKHGICLMNGIGTIDSDYTGEMGVILLNLGSDPFIVNHGDKIAQMVIKKYSSAKFKIVNELDKTTRGDGGYGHTTLRDKGGQHRK